MGRESVALLDRRGGVPEAKSAIKLKPSPGFAQQRAAWLKEVENGPHHDLGLNGDSCPDSDHPFFELILRRLAMPTSPNHSTTSPSAPLSSAYLTEASSR